MFFPIPPYKIGAKGTDFVVVECIVEAIGKNPAGIQEQVFSVAPW